MARSWRSIAVIAASLLCGCAAYKPAPLDPAKTERQFQARTLFNPGLCDYLKANLGAALSVCPPHQWDLATLTLVGFYYSPELAVSEARVGQAEAAIITAGGRPNPTVVVGPQYDERSSPSFAPWGIATFRLSVPIETAGKRQRRIAQAEQLADAARLSLGDTAWAVRSQIRSTLLRYLLAVRQRDVADEAKRTFARMVDLVEQRVQTGGVSQPDLSLARSQLQSATAQAQQARAQVLDARNALAAALGVPLEALHGVQLSWRDLEHPPGTGLLSPTRIQHTALLNRLDLRRDLVQYAAADQALRLEIAKQYPDINLLGGYSWEGGENLFEIGPSVVLPILNQNQGPIAEAEAGRNTARAEFLALQARVIAEAGGRLMNYRAALRALQASGRAHRLQTQRLKAAARAVTLGEADRLTLAQTRLQQLAAKQAFLAALADAQSALGALEDAVQRPLTGGDVGSFSFPRSGARNVQVEG